MNKVRTLITKYQGMSQVVRNSLWFTLCNYLQRGTALITVPVFTRLLTTEQYGVCNVYFAWFELIIIFTSLQLPYEGLNNGLIRHEEQKDVYASSIAGLILTLTLVMELVLYPFRNFFYLFTGLSPLLFLFMLLQLYCNPALMLWTNRKRFDYEYRFPVIITMLSTLLAPVISVTLVILSPYKAEARVAGTVVVQIFFGLLCYIMLFYKGRCFYHKDYWKFAVSFNLPLLMYYLSQSLLNQADRVMINYYAGKTEAGIYSVAYTAASLVLLIVNAVNGSFAPWMYRKIKEMDLNSIKKVATGLCLLMLAATMGMTAFAPDLVRLLATRDYLQAVWIIPPVSASVFFIFLYMIFANIEMYYGENAPISVISIIASLANVGLNAIFIPRFGYLAAGWTTLFSYGFLALLHYYLMRRALRLNQVEPFLPDRFLLLISTGVILMSLLMTLVYQIAGLRYVIIVLELLIVWFLRDKLMNLYHNIKKKA